MSYTNPVLLKALLISLVKEGGVNPSDITVYDVSRLFPDYMVKMCTDGELKGIQFVDWGNGVVDENTPSGTIYRDGNGHTVTNLGVHEHWNNSEQKLYSRNLGKEEGIELVQPGR